MDTEHISLLNAAFPGGAFHPGLKLYAPISSRTFLWMVRDLRDFKRRLISPATRQRRAAVWGGVERLSSGCQADAMFPGRLFAGIYRQTRRSRLNSHPNKHRRRLLVWNYRKGFHLEL
eukprot:3107065-Heterocapsa_arctica.AAC.1